MATLRADNMLKILISMLERAWKNEIIIGTAIRDFAILFKNMKFTQEEYDEFIRIYDTTYSLEQVSWDEFLNEYHLQLRLGSADETTND